MPESEIDRWMDLNRWRGKTYQALVDLNEELKQHRKENRQDISNLRDDIAQLHKDMNKFKTEMSHETGVLDGKMVVIIALVITIVGNIIGQVI